jgi:uncharacterized protein (UPF0332 family)
VPVELHRFLRSAQDLRLSGDYNLDYTAAPEEVEQEIVRAEQFLKVAESLIGSPPG